MDRKTIIDGLKMTMELCVFDPSTGEEIEPHLLNDINRATYDACKGALEILEQLPSAQPEIKTDGDTISRQAAIDAISCDITVTGRKNAEIVAATIGTFADKIKALPSAELDSRETKRDSSDLISRQDVIELVKDSYYNLAESMADTWAMVEDVERLPSAEPQERKGKWIYGEKDCQDGWYCSECKFFIPWDYDYYGLNNIDFIRDYHTCPHCDAKMLTYTGAKMEVEHEISD